MPGYQEDLAYIHHAGFGGFARGAAPELLEILRRNGIRRGLVVDLGCGSGIWASELSRAGYDVLGADISAAMIRLARKSAPKARFAKGSLLRAALPRCDAATSIGECVNYCFDPGGSKAALARLFRRVYEALRPGGMLVFDFAEPGQVPARMTARKHSQGEDWAVLVEAEEDRRRRRLTRRITSFRKLGPLYRRSEERHRLRLYEGAELLADVRRAGFEARLVRGYGRFRLPAAHGAIVARKRRASRA